MDLCASCRDIQVVLHAAASNATYTIGFDATNDVVLSSTFYDMLSIGIFDHESHMSEEPLIRNHLGQPDYISSVFYLVNCIQEYYADQKSLDSLGRFKYEASLQYKYKIIYQNIVISYIDAFLNKLGCYPNKNKSTIHISHDIDMLTSGFKQEFRFALKSKNISLAKDLVIQKLRLQSPWNNIENVVDLNKKLKVDATFFFLPKMGKSNADYDLMNYLVQVNYCTQEGMEVGLHKSISDHTIRKEKNEFPVPITKNRNHFLKFALPDHWSHTQAAGISEDHSLGFSRQIGFRNSFGYPFTPFNVEEDRPYEFKVFPLHIMDVALANYSSGDRHKIVKEVMEYVTTNKYDAHLELLWHNNSLTPYSNQYLLEAYQDLVDIFKEEGLLNKKGRSHNP